MTVTPTHYELSPNKSIIYFKIVIRNLVATHIYMKNRDKDTKTGRYFMLRRSSLRPRKEERKVLT